MKNVAVAEGLKYIIENYGMEALLDTLIDVVSQSNTSSDHYLTLLESDLETALVHYQSRNEEENEVD
jgi:hypothetical protein